MPQNFQLTEHPPEPVWQVIVFFGKVGTGINYDNKFFLKMKMKKSCQILNRLPSVRYQIHWKLKEIFSIMDQDYGPSVRI